MQRSYSLAENMTIVLFLLGWLMLLGTAAMTWLAWAEWGAWTGIVYLISGALSTAFLFAIASLGSLLLDIARALMALRDSADADRKEAGARYSDLLKQIRSPTATSTTSAAADSGMVAIPIIDPDGILRAERRSTT